MNYMKRSIIITMALWITSATLVWGQWGSANPMLRQGTWTFNVGGLIDHDGDDLGASISVSGGEFFQDYLEFGFLTDLSFRGSDFLSLGLGGYGEYHFFQGTPWVPYAGGSLGLGYFDFMDDSDFYLEMRGYGGTRFFFIDYAAIGADFGLKLATDKIYNRGDDRFDWEIRLRTSWYF